MYTLTNCNFFTDFWLGIAGFIFFISLIAALCRRRRMQAAATARRNHLQTAVVQQTVSGYTVGSFFIEFYARSSVLFFYNNR